ncbi:LamG domain-containing protein [Streptomyces sp. CB01635]|uniref:LamG domain-containing protein n=1 Tax=unclassified Streptomyces TaxID=2593676 RepID=UPI001F22B29E|nr:LamG domain-containing protein [Streptomyces sp. CB01635]
MRLPRTRRAAMARTAVGAPPEPRVGHTRSPRRTRRTALAAVALASVAVLAAAALPAQASGPAAKVPAQADGHAEHGSLRSHAVAAYDFGHPDPADPSKERDIGRSRTPLALINGGSAMRVADEAYPGSSPALQVRQQNPATAGNDDWKAGTWNEAGVGSLGAFNSAKAATVMGWFKMTGDNPTLNSNTANPTDRYGAIGLAGVLSGTSDGHAVRALLELIQVNGELKLVALGRRLDSGASQTFAASADWQQLLPRGEWVHLAATFDFRDGTMALYRDGKPLDGFYVTPGDPWELTTTPAPHRASPTDPRGIKIGGSFPQNTRENNACDCRMDDLLFLDRQMTAGQVRAEYRRMTRGR